MENIRLEFLRDYHHLFGKPSTVKSSKEYDAGPEEQMMPGRNDEE
jgi:hypothetical protein